MTYTITETVETVPWTTGIANASATLVKLAKEKAEVGEVVSFAKQQLDPTRYRWVLLTVNSTGQLIVAERDTVTIIVGGVEVLTSVNS